MSKAVFLCDVSVNLKEGIYKKVREQARVISEIEGETILFSKVKKIYTMVLFQDGKEICFKEIPDFYKTIYQFLNGCKIVYIRHMLPTFYMLRLIKNIKKMGCRLIYEIPTYPYFTEQIKESPKKIRTGIRLAIDFVAWPYLYSQIDKLLVIRSNTKVRILKKMNLISNGIAKLNIKPFEIIDRSDEKIKNIIVVGTLYAYHGIDRLLYSLKKYYLYEEGEKINFHVVGESNEIEKLKDIVKNEAIPNVFFHGTMTTEELMQFYPKMDLGIGCLALYRRNADIDTTLKVVEYLCYGLPVLTSGRFPIEIKQFSNIRIKIHNNKEIFSIKKIINKLNKISLMDRKNAQIAALANLTWDNIIRNILI